MNMEKINQNIKKKNQKSHVAQQRTGIYEAEKKKKKRDTDKINLPCPKLSN